MDEEERPNIFNSARLNDLFHFSHFSHFYRTYVPASFLIGLICGFFMVAFQILIDLTISALNWLPIFISPLIGVLFSGLLLYFGMDEIEGSGISKAIELTHEPAELQNRTALTKLLATSISIGSGSPVGREGPAVLIGAAIGNLVGRKLGYIKVKKSHVMMKSQNTTLRLMFQRSSYLINKKKIQTHIDLIIMKNEITTKLILKYTIAS